MNAKNKTAAMTFITPPASQGQIVEVAYATDDDASLLVRRTTDQAIPPGEAGRVVFHSVDLAEVEGEIEPWNAEPSVGEGDWDEADE